MPHNTYRVRIPPGTRDDWRLVTYAAGFTAPSTQHSRTLLGIIKGYAEYTVTLDEPGSPRTHWWLDTGLPSAADLSLSAQKYGCLTLWLQPRQDALLVITGIPGRVAVYAQVNDGERQLSSSVTVPPSDQPQTVRLFLPQAVRGAQLYAAEAGVVAVLHNSLPDSFTRWDFAGNALDPDQVDRLLGWAAASKTLQQVDVSGTDMAATSPKSCEALRQLAQSRVAVNHEAMATPCPFVRQLQVDDNGKLIWPSAPDWPFWENHQWSLQDGELVIDGPEADNFTRVEDQVHVTAPNEEFTYA